MHTDNRIFEFRPPFPPRQTREFQRDPVRSKLIIGRANENFQRRKWSPPERFNPACVLSDTNHTAHSLPEVARNEARSGVGAISGRNYNPGVDWPVGQPRIIPDRSIAEPSILIANCFRPSFVSSWPAGDVTRGSLQRCTAVQRLQIARILPLRVLRIVRPPTFHSLVHPSIHRLRVYTRFRFRSVRVDDAHVEFMDRWNLITPEWILWHLPRRITNFVSSLLNLDSLIGIVEYYSRIDSIFWWI